MNKEKIKAIQSLKTAKGQVEGIINMIEDSRYCIDVSNQLLAVQSLIKKANMLILKQHLENCVKDACNNDDVDNKLAEITTVLEKIMK